MYSNQTYLSTLLIEAGEIDAQVVAQLRADQPGLDNEVDTLIKQGAITEDRVAKVIATNSGSPRVDLSRYVFPEGIETRCPREIAEKYAIIPLGDDGNELSVCIADALNFDTTDSITRILGRQLVFYVATPTEINDAMLSLYGTTSGDVDTDVVTVVGAEGAEKASEADAPIIKLTNQILSDAVKQGISDIHIEPMEKSLRVRYRLDGKLFEAANHPKRLLPAVIARYKVMSRSMKISEKRIPQDGRIQLRIGEKEVDLRVSSVPSNHGESIVMRILNKSSVSLGLDQAGFLSDDLDLFRELVTLPDGIILVTGPTGSGKTTTLYSCLNEINKPDRKIITVEDPVEYELSGINQVMVRSDIGMTFAAALRAMLRQAPNIIMVGEIRDAETANISINAALTGHLVFSTLHTNDATSSVARLADMGVKKFLIASAVRAIVAQRLVRRLCNNCKAPVQLTEVQLKSMGISPDKASGLETFGPVGCGSCRQSGYKGRLGIFEIFLLDDEIRHLINNDLSAPQLRKRARDLGMRTLREDGVRKVLAGMTSAEEILSSTQED